MSTLIRTHPALRYFVQFLGVLLLAALSRSPLESDQDLRLGSAVRTTRSLQRLESADAPVHGAEESDPVIAHHGDQVAAPGVVVSAASTSAAAPQTAAHVGSASTAAVLPPTIPVVRPDETRRTRQPQTEAFIPAQGVPTIRGRAPPAA